MVRSTLPLGGRLGNPGGRGEFGPETPSIEDVSGLIPWFGKGRDGFCMIFKGGHGYLSGLV